MDATLDYSPPKTKPAAKPLSERLNLRLWIFLLVIAIPFAWVFWTIFGQSMISKHGDYYAVDLKAMGFFPFDAKRDDERAIPKDVLALNGKKVYFEGQMYAPSEASPFVHDFQLVYSIVACCMGGPPKVQERVFAFVPEHKHIRNYSGEQVTCTGTLHIKVVRDANGEAVSVFTMDVDEVNPKS
jgi:hypothetical protein